MVVFEFGTGLLDISILGRSIPESTILICCKLAQESCEVYSSNTRNLEINPLLTTVAAPRNMYSNRLASDISIV